MIELSVAPELSHVHLIAIELEDVQVAAAPVKLRLWADGLVAEALELSTRPQADKLRSGVRQMLRHGKFKASGRSKPAQEYLLRCAQEEGALPRINGPVDVLNACSLLGGLPISLLSLRKVGSQLLVRYGATDEGFAFNASGQVLDVEDLIVICDATKDPTRPVGSPIKDSMAGKIESWDNQLVAIIYAPRDALGLAAAERTASLLAENLVTHCQAKLGQTIKI